MSGRQLAQFIKGREARQCRDRYLKYLAPNVVNGPWTPEEEDLLTEKFNIYGSSWKTIATFFPTRTDVNIKSKWKKMQRHITKELLSNSNNYSNESVFSSSDSENSPIISQATTPKEQEEYVINMVNEEDPYIFDGLWNTIMDDESFFEYEM